MPEKTNKSIRVRMAPSPTGFLHIGTARTTLFNFLFARHFEGKFILRIEDTDAERSKVEHELGLIEGLHWLGLDWDEGPEISGDTILSKGDYGPYRQSERTEIYRKYLEKLLAEKKAYYCYCTKEELEAQRQSLAAAGLPPRYTGRCRDISAPPADRNPQVIRFRTPEIKVRFNDLIRGTVEFDASLFGDMVIARSPDSPLYNFANVIDDELMKISHVIRGEEHLSNTPKQILIAAALGFKPPTFAHTPLILDPHGPGKLSKRRSESSLMDYKAKGYLPEALVNFMVLLGWHPAGNKEIFTLNELIHEFDLKRVQKQGAKFDTDKLDWINAQHIRNLSTDELAARVKPFLDAEGIEANHDFLVRVLELEKYRLKTFADLVPMSGFFFHADDYDPKLLIWKGDTKEKSLAMLEEVYVILASRLETGFERTELLDDLKPLMEKEGKGSVLWPLRAALSGRERSPDPFEIAEVLGKHETLTRIQWAIDSLKTA
jgi:nondiscriminating glutamyl-tRNA synthetase